VLFKNSDLKFSDEQRVGDEESILLWIFYKYNAAFTFLKCTLFKKKKKQNFLQCFNDPNSDKDWARNDTWAKTFTSKISVCVQLHVHIGTFSVVLTDLCHSSRSCPTVFSLTVGERNKVEGGVQKVIVTHSLVFQKF
jgi:hypothetical protein